MVFSGFLVVFVIPSFVKDDTHKSLSAKPFSLKVKKELMLLGTREGRPEVAQIEKCNLGRFPGRKTTRGKTYKP